MVVFDGQTMSMYSALMMRSDVKVDCEFESEFKCGYASSVIGPLSWIRTNSASQLKKLTGPPMDRAGSTTGKLMYTVRPLQIGMVV